ncbi:MAG: HU family DNA-binding protein [Bacteroidaceae bacterium]|nr:HU family DNA-binding protein [Bacteroidaceae bacterium]
MAFYKVRLQKKSGLYYPQSITVGKQVSTKQLGKALSDRSTVTLADTLAVLSELGTVMSTFMAQGRSVQLDGLGSFRYTINATKQGVEKEEDVSPNQIKSIRVRFVPEMTRNADKTVATRSMQPTAVDWFLWGKEVDKASAEGDEGGSDGTEGGQGNGDAGDEGNPL